MLTQGLEGAALVALATYVAFQAALGESSSPGAAAALTITAAVLGLGALLVCRGLYRHRRWSRAPAAVTQIFALPVAVTFLRSGRAEVAIPLAIAAIATLLTLAYLSANPTLSDESERAAPPS